MEVTNPAHVDNSHYLIHSSNLLSWILIGQKQRLQPVKVEGVLTFLMVRLVQQFVVRYFGLVLDFPVEKIGSEIPIIGPMEKAVEEEERMQPAVEHGQFQRFLGWEHIEDNIQYSNIVKNRIPQALLNCLHSFIFVPLFLTHFLFPPHLICGLFAGSCRRNQR